MSHLDKTVTQQSLFSLSWPIFIDLSLHFATLLINTYMVSQISTAYLASMGVGNEIFNFFITIFSFISVGCSVVVAQYLGRGNGELTRQVMHIAIAFNFLLGILCALAILLFGHELLRVMNTPQELVEDAFAYLSILGICLIPESVTLILAACLRVYGKTKVSMYVTLLVNVLSVAGNYIALHGLWGMPTFGLQGVAWSTVMGRVVAVILLFFLLSYGLRIRFQIIDFFRWSRQLLSKILSVGIPSALDNLSWFLQYMTAYAFIGLLGKTALASQTLYFEISHFVMLFGIAVGIGNGILVGHYVGAKQFDKAYHSTFRCLRPGVIVTIVVVVMFWLFREPILSVLTQDQQIIQLLLPLVLLSVFLEPGRTFNIVIVNALRASGDAKFPLYISLICMWGVSIPVGYYLGIKLEMGLIGIWFGFLCDEWLRGAINLLRWKSRRWESKRLVSDD